MPASFFIVCSSFRQYAKAADRPSNARPCCDFKLIVRRFPHVSPTNQLFNALLGLAMHGLSPSLANSKPAIAPSLAYFDVRRRFLDDHTQNLRPAFEGKPVVAGLDELA
ncbi:MAG: hypothetical protein ABR929_06015 [Roseiarcus sp.]